MEYTTDNPPLIVQGLLDEYEEVEVTSCGYNGSWAELRLEDKSKIKIRREVTNDVTFKLQASGQLKSYNTHEKDVATRDEQVSDFLVDELGGYYTLVDAIEDHPDLRLQ